MKEGFLGAVHGVCDVLVIFVQLVVTCCEGQCVHFVEESVGDGGDAVLFAEERFVQGPG